jgi:serine/threonine-protein kinase
MDKISSGKIGRYEIVRILGHGGLGEMILAEDQALRRKVTIKRLTGSPVATDVARFQLEIKAAASRHPNMPIVYEMGTHDNLPFIAMEFVEGESLATIIESKRELDVISKLKMIEQVCTALGYAHKNGIVYGELTLENIIVQANGVVKIIDFGIAKIPRGTFQTGTVDTRVDLRSAGVALFKLLTGKDQYTAADGSDPHGIINNAALHELSPALAEIVQNALAEDAESPYQTGEQFAEALHKLIKNLTDARVMELLTDAERLMAERRFEPALELFDEAIRLAPSNAAAMKRRKSLRAHHEKIRRAERIRECLRCSAEALLLGKFDESLSHLRDAGNLDPKSEDIKTKIQSVEDEKRRFENCVRALEEAERAKALGDFGAALRLTTNALQEDPTNGELLALSAALAMQMEMEVRKDRLLEVLELAERNLAAGNYDAAANLLNEAMDIDPSHQKAEKLRLELTKAHGLEQHRAFLDEIQRRIRDLFTRDAYDEALEVVSRALDTFPDEVLLHSLRAEVEAEERRYDVRQVVDLVIAEVDELFVHYPSEALSVLGKALDNMPDEARLVAYELALRQQIESGGSEYPAGARL